MGVRSLNSDAVSAATAGGHITLSPDNSAGSDNRRNASANGIESFSRISVPLWDRISAGLQQRFQAIDLFLTDVITHEQAPGFLHSYPEAAAVMARRSGTLAGSRPGMGNWTWLASSDLVIRENCDPILLDHNLECPVGLLRLADLSGEAETSSVVGNWLRSQLQFGWCELENAVDRLRVAVLDAGSFSPAYRENEFLATQLGGRLICNRDLVVNLDGVFATHHRQQERIDIVVRRIEDEMLDPNSFRPDSLIGVPGLVRACREGPACVLNPPGTGVISNRTVSAMIPDMIRHYLGESPLLESVSMLMCGNSDDRNQLLGNLRSYAVRTVDPLHPARPFFGSTATPAELAEVAVRVQRDPQNYVARPLISGLAAPRDGFRPSFNLRLFSGVANGFSMLPLGIGRPPQPDGGATLAIISDPTAFLVTAPVA